MGTILEAKTHGDGASMRERVALFVRVFISPDYAFHFAVLNIPHHVRARV